MKKVTVKNEIKELDKLYSTMNEVASEHNLSEELINDLCVCLDEVFSNIVNHAYEGSEGEGHDIEVQFDFDETDKKVKISFIDMGKEFNPLEAGDPDLSLDLLEREIGGLGIFIVSNLMTSVEYSRLGDKNKLEMTKDIE